MPVSFSMNGIHIFVENPENGLHDVCPYFFTGGSHRGMNTNPSVESEVDGKNSYGFIHLVESKFRKKGCGYFSDWLGIGKKSGYAWKIGI